MPSPCFYKTAMKNNNKENNEAVSTIAKEIAKAIGYASSSYDRTFISMISSINEDGSYNVSDEYGIVRSIGCIIPNLELAVRQRVFVTIPCNNINNMFIAGVVPKMNKR